MTPKIIALNVAVYVPCRCCGVAGYCYHLDWELRGLICKECGKTLVEVEIQLQAWTQCEAEALTCWPALRPDGRYYNSPVDGRAR